MFFEDWWCFLQTVSPSQSCHPVCLFLPSPWGNEKQQGREQQNWVIRGRVWSPILVPSLVIYFVPVSLGFLSIIINKITAEASPWICVSVWPCLHTQVRHQVQGQTHRGTQYYYHYFVMGQRAEGKIHPNSTFLFFHLDSCPWRYLFHIMASTAVSHRHILSTARKDMDFINVYYFYISSLETVL